MPEIVEQVTVDPVPGAQAEEQGLPAAPTDATLTADPTKRYFVTGSVWTGWVLWGNYLRALPRLTDDLEETLGDDVYDNQYKDPKVRSQVDLLALKALKAEGVLETPVPDTHPQYEKASDIRDFCQASLENLNRALSLTLRTLLIGALKYGNKVAEQTYEIPTAGEHKDRLMLMDLSVKPRRNIAFVVDRFMRVIGMLGIVNPIGGSFFGLFQSIVDPATTPNLLPRKKFVVLTLLVDNEDPRGQSWLRSVYTAWWRKLQLFGERMKHCTQLAGGMLKATTPQEAQAAYRRDSSGNIMLDQAGNPIEITPEEVLGTRLEAAQNGAVLVLPYGSEVDILAADGAGETFNLAIEDENRAIAEGITFASLATTESKHDTRAASQTHQDNFDDVVSYIRLCVEETVRRDILRPIVESNYGPEYVGLVPHYRLSDTPNEDRSKLMVAVSELEKVGYWTPEQKQQLDGQMGVKPRTDDDVAEEREATTAGREMLQDNTGGGDGEDDQQGDDGLEEAA